MNTQHILQFLTANQQLIMVCAVSLIVIVTLLAFNDSLRRKNKKLKGEAESNKRLVNDVKRKFISDTDDLKLQHEHELEARANIAYANIKRYRDEIRELKDQHRVTALEKAEKIREGCDGDFEIMITLARGIYKFLAGK